MNDQNRARQIKNFLILSKAYALGVYSTNLSMSAVFEMAAGIDDKTIDGIIVNVCIAEGPYAKHVI